MNTKPLHESSKEQSQAFFVLKLERESNKSAGHADMAACTVGAEPHRERD